MKFFINQVEVSEELFHDKFLSCRILDEERNDLSLIYIRALSEFLLDSKEKRDAFTRTISSYEVRRAFRETRLVSLLGYLFEIKDEEVEQPKEGE